VQGVEQLTRNQEGGDARQSTRRCRAESTRRCRAENRWRCFIRLSQLIFDMTCGVGGAHLLTLLSYRASFIPSRESGWPELPAHAFAKLACKHSARPSRHTDGTGVVEQNQNQAHDHHASAQGAL